ncbi:ATP-binding cassette domain-containing protein [Peptoniphilaceae bacterium SGI.137]
MADLPEGYDTVLGQNFPIRLSGGQLARLNFAHVLLKQSSIYILDEFSAELDVEPENGILSSKKSLFYQRRIGSGKCTRRHWKKSS